jgi:hypothetical protein
MAELICARIIEDAHIKTEDIFSKTHQTGMWSE